jgi:hypothetical protein
MLVLSVQERGMASMRFFWPAVAARRGRVPMLHPLLRDVGGEDYCCDLVKKYLGVHP